MEWIEENKRLVKEFKLKNFSAITEKLQEIAIKADEIDHHPDFQVYGYNHIKFSLSTHTTNGVTEKDYALAKEIDNILS